MYPDKMRPPTAEEQATIDAFDREVRIRMDRGLDRQRAISSLVKASPLLHQQYLAAVNRR
jgi:hypothetical protein